MNKALMVLGALVVLGAAAATGRAIASAADSAGIAPSDAGDNVLQLNVTDVYVQPSEAVSVTLDISHLLESVNGCQAIIGYEPLLLTAAGATQGGADWDTLIYAAFGSGKMAVAVGVDLRGDIGVTDDATIATLTFVPTGPEGKTFIWFRQDVSDVESTMLGSMFAQPIYPEKVDSPVITIDGTVPNIQIVSATQGGTDLLSGSPAALQGPVTITVAASDALAGLAGVPAVTVTPSGATAEDITSSGVNNGDGTFTYTFLVTSSTNSGPAAIHAIGTDRAGNSSFDDASFMINRGRVTGTVELEGLASSGSIVRAITFKASDGSGAQKTWLVDVTFNAGSSRGDYALDDVPAGTTGISAKSAWSLRRKLPVTLNGGDSVVNFTDSAGMLMGGDINGTNTVNLADYIVMKYYWFTSDPQADITGNGVVGLADYVIMKRNWFKTGDAE